MSAMTTVWGCFFITAAVIVIDAVSVLRNKRKIIEKLRAAWSESK
jgi:heme exporter protein CcmD